MICLPCLNQWSCAICPMLPRLQPHPSMSAYSLPRQSKILHASSAGNQAHGACPLLPPLLVHDAPHCPPSSVFAASSSGLQVLNKWSACQLLPGGPLCPLLPALSLLGPGSCCPTPFKPHQPTPHSYPLLDAVVQANREAPTLRFTSSRDEVPRINTTAAIGE